jgi:hypothetical protein
MSLVGAKSVLKGVLAQVLSPQRYSSIKSMWGRHKSRQFERRLDLPRIARSIAHRHGLTVLHGPFRGMKFTARHLKYFNIVTKLLGSYEAELEPLVRQILDTPYETIVNVGSAEGYYAVGFALRKRNVKVYAFDSYGLARRLCVELARENQVADRVDVRDWCDQDTLRGLLQGRVLFFCDVDGYEIELLRPDHVPEFAACDMLVETHDILVPNVTDTICERFHNSHRIRVIECVEREPSPYPELSFLSASDKALAVCEFRDKSQRWLFMTPTARPIA